jgi:hypothetical protein
MAEPDQSRSEAAVKGDHKESRSGRTFDCGEGGGNVSIC